MEGFPQNKRESGIARVIGVEAKEEKELLEILREQFKGGKQRAWEKDKTAEQAELIGKVNEFLKDFLKQYEVEALTIPVENIHCVDLDKLTPAQRAIAEKRGGAYIPEMQAIGLYIPYESGKMRFLHNLIHEMLHANSFHSIEKVTQNEDAEGVFLIKKNGGGMEEGLKFKMRRSGFAIFGKKGEKYFEDIDEALIEELMMRFEWRYFFQIPAIAEEYKMKEEWMEIQHRGSEGEANKIRREIARVEGLQWGDDGYWEAGIIGYQYKNERAELRVLIDDLYEKNKDHFTSREDVFAVFVKAAMTGKLFEVGRLVTKTYGQGSFRELGERTAKRKAEDLGE